MAKKKVDEPVFTEGKFDSFLKKEVIHPITREYNREDLNELKNKINELIARQ